MRKIRASYYFIGALLGKYKSAEVPLPGGCTIGSRPIDQHLKGFRALGSDVKIVRGAVVAHAIDLVASHIYLDVVSVGATINIMMAATMAEGETILENVAKEPHVVDVANFLNSMGANIKGAGYGCDPYQRCKTSSRNKLFDHPGSDRGRNIYVCRSDHPR